MSIKIHLQEEDRPVAACGRRGSKMARDPGLVTCAHCQTEIERLLETPEEEARRRAGPRAKAIARQRALSVLKDRYPEEYRREAMKALREVYPELLEEETRFIQRYREIHE